MRHLTPLIALLALVVSLLTGCGQDTVRSGSVPDATLDADLDVQSEGDPGPDATDAATDVPLDPEDAHPPDPADTAQPDGVGDVADDDASTEDPLPDVADVVDETTPCPNGIPPTRIGDTLGTFVGWEQRTLPRCERFALPLVSANDTRWQVNVAELPPDARLFVYTAHFFDRPTSAVPLEPLARADVDASGAAEVTFTAPLSGELALVIERRDHRSQNAFRTRVTCLEGCSREATLYPIVLLHGYAGADSYFGLLDYFYGVQAHLEARGYAVFTPVSNPIATSEDRVSELEPQLAAILETTGARRLHLVGHSQGGLDARILAHGDAFGSRIASVTTIATPHAGIGVRLADFISVQNFGTSFMEDTFNPRYTDREGVLYWSWSARACRPLQRTCLDETGGSSVDALLLASHAVIEGERGSNDGIVPTSSMFWGEHLGELPADHFKQIGQILRGPNASGPFQHRAFYLSEAQRLRDLGL